MGKGLVGGRQQAREERQQQGGKEGGARTGGCVSQHIQGGRKAMIGGLASRAIMTALL
jgi:hypothetical protein